MSFFKHGCQKTGPIIYKSGKTGSVIYVFLEKRVYCPAYRIPGSAERGWGLFGTHIRTMPYVGSDPLPLSIDISAADYKCCVKHSCSLA